MSCSTCNHADHDAGRCKQCNCGESEIGFNTSNSRAYESARSLRMQERDDFNLVIKTWFESSYREDVTEKMHYVSYR